MLTPSGCRFFPGAYDVVRQSKELLHAANADDIVLFGGGIIPEADRQALAEMGVAEVFTPGATMTDIVSGTRERGDRARG
jgi:methylmalonyl-CoA mutase C-terminal domain/subunit